MKDLTIKQKMYSLLLGYFLLAIGLAQFAYIESTFLNKFFDLKIVGVIFFITYLITFAVINEYPNFIAKYNNLKTSIFVLLLEILSLLLFILWPHPIIVLFTFIVYIITTNLIAINFDIFLETYTSNVATGKTRGIFYTLYNLGWVITPFWAGRIFQNFGFNLLFLFIILFALLTILLLLITFKKFKNHYTHKHFHFQNTLKEVAKRPNIKKIFYAAFLLQVFYAIMVIYTPIYLSQTIGLSWQQIGMIFSIMLLPFVLLQYLAGYLADKYLGEKELLTAGLLIMSLATLIIFFINSQSLAIWALILFFSRIGASLTEIMRDTYFFKKVEAKNIDLINAFRSTTPLAYIIMPLIASLILLFLPLKFLFLFLSLILLTGLYPALTIKDTK